MKKIIICLAYSIIPFLIVPAFFLSCNKTENIAVKAADSLTGTWVDTIHAIPAGYYVYVLQFNTNSTFTLKSSSFGTYGGQSVDELSGWFEFSGDYSRNGDRICFVSHKVISWDSFYGGQPDTQIQDQLLFENCRFKITGKVLELNYITYPADAPENTMQQYTKVN